MATVTIVPTTGSLGPTPEVMVNVPVTVTVTGLATSTSHFLFINDPDGGHSGPGPRLYTSDASGTIAVTTVIAGAAGQGAISVYNALPTTTVTNTFTIVAAP